MSRQDPYLMLKFHHHHHQQKSSKSRNTCVKMRVELQGTSNSSSPGENRPTSPVQHPAGDQHPAPPSQAQYVPVRITKRRSKSSLNEALSIITIYERSDFSARTHQSSDQFIHSSAIYSTQHQPHQHQHHRCGPECQLPPSAWKEEQQDFGTQKVGLNKQYNPCAW